MRSRSARCWSSHFGKGLGLASVALGLSSAAQGAITVKVLSHGGVDNVNTSTTTLWYAAKAGAVAAGDFFIDSAAGYAAVDVTQSQAKEGGSLASALRFEVTSDKAVTGLKPGESLALVVTATNVPGSGTAKYVAIAGVNETFCTNSGACRTAGLNGSTGYSDPSGGASSLYYFAVPYTTNAPMQLALYPKDICTSYYAQGGFSASGCINDATETGIHHETVGIASSASSVLGLQLTFQVQVLDANGNLTNPPPAPQDSGTLMLRFEDGQRDTFAPVSCPSTAISYFPGDGQIFVDTSPFSSVAQSSQAYAPLSVGIVVGRKNSIDPAIDANYAGNDVVSRTGLGVNSPVPGFQNLTSAGDTEHTYNIGFLLRDTAGVISIPKAAGTVPQGCVIQGVQTSAIQGFLSKSNCFIATAAFRSIDAAPVEMLRAFRDQVLRRSAAGTEFIHWYYRWSPGAAEWLMNHPEFRYPVLRALVPLEIGAWLILHPTWLGFVLLMALGAAAFILGIGFARIPGRRAFR